MSAKYLSFSNHSLAVLFSDKNGASWQRSLFSLQLSYFSLWRPSWVRLLIKNSCEIFFRPNQRPLKGFAWQASWGQLTCPHHPFVNRQSQDPEQSCVENACSPVSHAFWTIFPFLAQVPSFLGMFSLRPWAKVFLRCLYLWGRRGNPWRHPPPCSDSVPVPFHSQPDPEPSYLTAGVHKMARTFCLGLPHQWDGPKCLCWFTWLWWALPQEKQNRGSRCFFLV